MRPGRFAESAVTVGVARLPPPIEAWIWAVTPSYRTSTDVLFGKRRALSFVLFSPGVLGTLKRH
jgi:hypothetical protein